MGGINTAINHRGHSFHIQTQDQGMKTKLIETLIYKSGKILVSRKTPYASLVGSPVSEEKIIKLMKEQHETVINDIREGRLDHKLGLEKKPSEPETKTKSIPHPLKSISDRIRKIEVKLEDFSYSSPSVPISLSLQAEEGTPPAPASFLKITILAITEYGQEFPMFEGLTDEKGRLVLGLMLPEFTSPRFFLSVKGEKEGMASDELKIYLKKD